MAEEMEILSKHDNNVTVIGWIAIMYPIKMDKQYTWVRKNKDYSVYIKLKAKQCYIVCGLKNIQEN